MGLTFPFKDSVEALSPLHPSSGRLSVMTLSVSTGRESPLTARSVELAGKGLAEMRRIAMKIKIINIFEF